MAATAQPVAQLQAPLPDTLSYTPRIISDDPDEQVADTIDLMAQYVREDAHTPEVEAAAGEALVMGGGGGGDDYLEGVYAYVRRLVRFQHDEVTAQPLRSGLVEAGLGDYPVVEVLVRPRDMVTWRQDTGGGQPKGDCDDYAMLTAALLRAKGVKAKFVTVAADPRMPGQWSHVYVVAYLGGKRVPLDTSHGDYPGWEASEYVTRRQEWDVDGAGLKQWLVIGLVAWAVMARYLKRWKGATL